MLFFRIEKVLKILSLGNVSPTLPKRWSGMVGGGEGEGDVGAWMIPEYPICFAQNLQIYLKLITGVYNRENDQNY